MSLLKLTTFDDPVLRAKCAEVPQVDARIRTLVKNMVETMYAERGVGLAAPQVGVAERILILDVGARRDGSEAIPLINPRLVKTSPEAEKGMEGCLSLPGMWYPVNRPARCIFEGQEISGKWKQFEGSALLARAFQHELDHLNGVLFLDQLDEPDKTEAWRLFPKRKVWEHSKKDQFLQAKTYEAFLASVLPDERSAFEKISAGLDWSKEAAKAFQGFGEEVHILALTTASPEARWALPVVDRVARSNPHIRFRVLRCEEAPDVSDIYRVGRRSKESPVRLIFFEDAFREFATWGPLSGLAREVKKRLQAELPGADFGEALAEFHVRDKGKAILCDLASLLSVRLPYD